MTHSRIYGYGKCVECGEEFPIRQPGAMYCSHRCNSRVASKRYYWRNRETVLANQKAARVKKKAA